jgi:hypothetical protein
MMCQLVRAIVTRIIELTEMCGQISERRVKSIRKEKNRKEEKEE